MKVLWTKIATEKTVPLVQVLINGLSGMYGPPQVCKRKTRVAVGFAVMYPALLESETPGHDGNPPAFVPLNWTVLEDHFRKQVSKAWV